MSYSHPIISHRMLVAAAVSQAQSSDARVWDPSPPPAPAGADGRSIVLELLEDPIAFYRDQVESPHKGYQPARA